MSGDDRRAEPADDNLPTLLRRYRDHYSWTQAQMGAALGVSRSQVANAEAGRTDLTASALLRLFHVTRTDVMPTNPDPTIRPGNMTQRRCEHCAAETMHVVHGDETACLQCIADGGTCCSLAAWNRWTAPHLDEATR